MQQQPIVRIQNLACSYNGNEQDKVFFISKLDIQKGKIIFLLGASGSGKSTLLETIGLMNNTIASGSVEFFYEPDKSFEYAALWKEKNLEKINHIRKNFLSFIFQNTNLMDNFTAYENICLSQMIKSNAGQSKAMTGARKLMSQVGLPESEVSLGALSVNLSGGQRQRVSFVRALNTDFKILLCDEPTGNLDEVNAHELLNIVKQNLTSEKTALLVSHDINLALKYADQIILLSKNPVKGYGEIAEEHIYNRDQWESLDEKAKNAFREKMVLHFKGPEKAVKEEKKEDEERSISSGYRSLFIRKEGRILFGKSNVNLLIMVSIIAITLLAIGFANGTLQYMNVKKNDAFVNWLTIGIPTSKNSASQVDEFREQLNSDEIRKHYLIDTVTTYKVILLPLFHKGTPETEFTQGRLLSPGDPLTSALFSKQNKISGKDDFNGENDLGIVVTQKLLHRLGYPDNARVIYLDNGDEDTTQSPPAVFKVPIPVRAVVKEIPGKNNFLVTNFFLAAFRATTDCVFNFREQQRKRILFYVDGNKDLANQLKEEIKKISGGFVLAEKTVKPAADLYENEVVDEYAGMEDETGKIPVDTTTAAESILTQQLNLDYHVDTCDEMSSAGYELAVDFDAIPYFYSTTERIVARILQLPFYQKNKEKIIRILDYNIANAESEDFNNDYLCINFKGGEGGLDSIEPFSTYLVNNLNKGTEKDQNNIIQVDSGSVKEKKNFNYISKMTFLIAGLLIVFAILAISLFISNLLKTHLNKVKMNLGTYKAFGLSDKESVAIYLQIMLRFIFTALAFAFVCAFLVGKVIGNWFETRLKIEDQVEYFRLFDVQTYLLLGIIILVTVSVSYINISRILSKTPGDLIYNR